MTQLTQLAGAPATIYAVSRGLLDDWLLGTDHGLWRINPDGALQQQSPALKNVRITALAHTTRGVFVGASDGIARTSDGETWTAAQIEAPIHVSHIAPTTATHQHGILFAVTLDHGLYRTMDAGLSWAPCNNGLENREAIAVAPSAGFYLNWVVYAAFADGVYHGTGAGSTWHRLGVPDEAIPPSGLLATSNGLLLASDAGLWTSADSGQTWLRQASIDGDILALACSPDTLWSVALTTERIMKSNDAGLSWQEVGPAPESAHTVAISDSGAVLCGTLENGAWLAD